jgi:hypothetical protein
LHRLGAAAIGSDWKKALQVSHYRPQSRFSPKLYDRRRDEVSLDELERIVI